ncbi:SRPBCC family protein [Falsihalocynthiibacter arcticus]|uniref:DNA polymerase III subunit gamma/tau n=1 Tax=Falsihalocynthiibacter arcticus TaxID=1579316 RepID=A0A126UZ18_9RHOB|nr:SRPBCC family protein [Falsihalocynthiibacter arcticus]AML51308.1 hypothetical protein RC74_08630 [Falsihalocynthiibacter arcticus]
MIFVSTEDIEAPIEVVYRAVSDFDSFERSALRRGLEVKPLDENALDGAVQGWNVVFQYRGKKRESAARLIDVVPDQGFTINGGTGGLHGAMVVDLVALSKMHTRLKVTVELSAKTLSSRLLLQSMKLAKTKLRQRFEKRVSTMAQDIEDRFKPGTKT